MFKPKESTPLERILDRTIRDLENHEIGSSEYQKRLNAVESLHKLKEEEKSKPVSRDTLVVVAANLLGIILIIKHENVNVITSRAMNLILKP